MQKKALRYGANIRWIKGACSNLLRISLELTNDHEVHNSIRVIQDLLLLLNKQAYNKK